MKKIKVLTILLAAGIIAFNAFGKTTEENKFAFSHLDAGEEGVFNIGLALGGVFRSFDEETGEKVFKFDYSASKGSILGVWTKDYPSGMGRKAVDAVRAGVKVSDREQLKQVAVRLEIKGEKAMQKIPLRTKHGWSYAEEAIDWNVIGDLREVVFVVSPSSAGTEGANTMWFNPAESGDATGGKVKPLEGVLYFSLGFYKLTFLQKYFIFAKIALIFIIGLVVSFLFGLFRKRFLNRTKISGRETIPAGDTITSRLKRDLLYGVVIVLVGIGALSIYAMGNVSPLITGFSLNFLVMALLGAVIAQTLKFGITGRHLTRLEVFQNVMLVGLLAASSSRLGILQVPSAWAQVLTMNKVVAMLAFLLYQIFNARSLALSGKHMRVVAGTLIVGVPYLFNWLLLLQNVTILQLLANIASANLLAAWPVVVTVVGRLLIVFGFNEAVAGGIGMATKGKVLKDLKAHVFIFFVSLGVVVSPLIADLGSTPAVGSLPEAIRGIIAILTTMFSFAGLWGEVYLITGMALDAGKRTEPSWETISGHVIPGMKKGMAYSGILMTILYALYMLINAPMSKMMASNLPIALGILAGGAIFPLLKTIIETFDGSQPFFQRVRHSYRDVTLCARGAISGFGFAYALTHGLIEWNMSSRILFGLGIGVLASGGVSIFRDMAYASKGRGKIQTWRLYFVDSLLGIFVGSAVAFYLDSLQVPVVIEKFKLYISAGFSPREYITYPLVNKWGRIDLGTYAGGAKLIFTESLAGVINWSVAAWLFAINKVFLLALFEKHTAPIKFFFSKAGLAQLIEHMIYVLRWGLWMSPIIFTFLRMMPDPTWYNQDGAVRTAFAIYHGVTTSPEAFRAWSLNVFIYILAFDFFRVLIWMDHMGLRVATLVNLSFIGLDRLDERIARFIGPATAQRYIPEAVKRFCTWGPLLIPFYLPRGKDWDYAWSTSEAMQNAAAGKSGIITVLHSLSLPEKIIFTLLAILVCTGISFAVRLFRHRSRLKRTKTYQLGNREYRVFLRESGEIYSEADHRKSGVFPPEYDISRRSYDIIDPCGRILYVVDEAENGESGKRYWPVVGNFPKNKFSASSIGKGDDDSLKVVNKTNGVETTIDIRLPDRDNAAEIWTITVKNTTYKRRRLKIVPYLEWVLNGGLHDRFHTQYARLFPEMEYVGSVNAILAWQKSTKAMGILASNVSPEGFLFSRMDFIGRAQSIWNPRALETMDFLNTPGTSSYPTFDPIGALMLDAAVNPRASRTIRLLIGYAKNKKDAVSLIRSHLVPLPGRRDFPAEEKKKSALIGHGEVPPGTPVPYGEYADNGNKFLVHTPYTPRPFDHAMSNAVGHSVMVTNRGLHTSCNGNSQQNRLTPDWPDTVTKEVPAEAIYLYDPDRNKWYSPTYHPLNEKSAENKAEFGVDGTAVFHMSHGNVSTKLEVFVPPHEPLGVYLLTVRNNADHSMRMRLGPYFQMVLEFQPERSGSLQIRRERATKALFFSNPRNMFRTGWAFASMSLLPECSETTRGKFFGKDREISRPFMVEKGKPDATGLADDRQIASFLATLNIPAGEERTVAIVLGQTDTYKEALSLVAAPS